MTPDAAAQVQSSLQSIDFPVGARAVESCVSTHLSAALYACVCMADSLASYGFAEYCRPWPKKGPDLNLEMPAYFADGSGRFYCTQSLSCG
jgi:hypothetical protein